MPLRLIFMGTPEFSVPTLLALVAHGHEIAAVYTRAAKPAGRGMKLQLGPVEEETRRLGIPVVTPTTLKTPQALEEFRAHDADAAVVVAYGMILPQAILDAPRLGCFNLHASLLPRWRGAAPIHRAIEAGDAETGITLMQMDAGLDTGAMIREGRIAIAPADTTATLHDRMAQLGADLIVDALRDLERDGALPATPQPQDGATYAQKIAKHEAALDWRRPASMLARQIRALDPFPGAFGTLDGVGMKIWAAEPIALAGDAEPGVIVESSAEGVLVACGQGGLRLTQLQKPGGKRLPVREFLAGSPIVKGQRFELREVAPDA
jgi:methionyl-tRNA formyltransferase